MDNTRPRNTPSPTNPEEDGIADTPGNDGNASMPEQVKRPNPWRKMMMMMMINNNHPHQALLTQRSDEAKIQHQMLPPALTLYLMITIIISRKMYAYYPTDMQLVGK